MITKSDQLIENWPNVGFSLSHIKVIEVNSLYCLAGT